MTIRRFAPGALLFAAVLLVIGLTLGAHLTGARAQTASPAATTGHPAHIHNGTCATLGDIMWPLTNLTPPGMMATPMPMMSATPMAGMGELESASETRVDASLDEITSGQHAINVHESQDNIQNYIACGDVQGTPTDGQLTIMLMELNGSGYEGTAMLQDNGDGSTTVTVMLYKMGGPAATPMA